MTKLSNCCQNTIIWNEIISKPCHDLHILLFRFMWMLEFKLFECKFFLSERRTIILFAIEKYISLEYLCVYTQAKISKLKWFTHSNWFINKYSDLVFANFFIFIVDKLIQVFEKSLTQNKMPQNEHKSKFHKL